MHRSTCGAKVLLLAQKESIYNIFFLDYDLDDYHRRAEEAKKKLKKKICDTLKIPLEKPKLVNNSPMEEESMLEVLKRSMGSKVSFKKINGVFMKKF